MINDIPSPQKGQPLLAAWAAQVTSGLNGIRAAGMRGVLVRDGAGAFGAEPLPENQRNRKGGTTASSPPAPFDLEYRTVDDATVLYVVRCRIAAPIATAYVYDANSAIADEVAMDDTTGTIYLHAERTTVDNSTAYKLSVDRSSTFDSDSPNATWVLWEWDATNSVYVDRRPRILPLYAL